MRCLKKILLVDEDDAFRGLLSKLLSTEFEVLESSGVKDARKKLEATSVDFICSDYNMRDGMGLDLLHYCKEMNTSTPFVLISAYDLDQLSRKAELFGISFCEKTDGEFLGKLKAALLNAEQSKLDNDFLKP